MMRSLRVSSTRRGCEPVRARIQASARAGPPRFVLAQIPTAHRDIVKRIWLRCAFLVIARRAPISGLPEIGHSNAQVEQARSAWPTKQSRAMQGLAARDCFVAFGSSQ
jgi:hypothetical protein